VEHLHSVNDEGSVVVGDPYFYPRFGFANTNEMFELGVPPEVFMAIRFTGDMWKGEVKFDEAFEAHE
jgi:putative acetyltransferase